MKAHSVKRRPNGPQRPQVQKPFLLSTKVGRRAKARERDWYQASVNGAERRGTWDGSARKRTPKWRKSAGSKVQEERAEDLAVKMAVVMAEREVMAAEMAAGVVVVTATREVTVDMEVVAVRMEMEKG